MQELKIIDRREVLGQDFKIYGDFESPLFLAKEVAEWIEHSDTSKMCNSVDEDEKVRNIVRTLGGNQECLFLTEDGLYEVLMQSRKPIAKEFKKQVKVILKEIRTKGSYSRPMTQTEIILAQAQALVDIERIATQAEQTAQATADKLNTALDIFASSIPESWKDETNRKINSICQQNGLNYQVFKGDLYTELERSASCNLTIRQRNLRARLKMAGATYKEHQAITKIDVIARDEHLKLIFDGIVRKYCAKYAY